MTKKANKIINIVLFLIVVILLFSKQKQIKEIISKQPNETKIEITPSVPPAAQLEFQVGNENHQFIATASGQNALELVESQVELSLKKYDFGVMIEGVNGLMADNKNYWAVYQNGEYAKTGIAQIELQKNDKIELKYEEITY